MMKQLTKQQAFLLGGHGYTLVDKEGVAWTIDMVAPTGFNASYKSRSKAIFFKEIGTDYHIQARPLSALTQPMEDGTIPIVEMAKIAWPLKKFQMSGLRAETDLMFAFGYDAAKKCFWSYDQMEGTDHDTPEQFALFNKYHDLHFPPQGVDESLIKFNL